MTTALQHLQSKLKLKYIVLLTLVWSHLQMRDEVVKNKHLHLVQSTLLLAHFRQFALC